MEIDPRSSKEARAARLTSLRKMTRLSRQEFAKKYKISASNFQNWEGPRYGGLTAKASHKILNARRCEGIICSLEWLLNGIGAGPEITEKLYSNTIKLPDNNHDPIAPNAENSLIAEELLLFRQHYKDTLELVVKDDAMEPYYKIGDYLAGKRFTTEVQFNKLINHDCIVQTNNGELLLRNLRTSNTPQRFTLACTNLNTSVDKPLLYDVEILSAAPIMWLRRSIKQHI